MLSWNKNKAFLRNRMDTIRQLVQDKSPHILALQEAQITQDDDVRMLQIQGYTLHTDGLYGAGNNSRTCVYTHNDLVVTSRPDLQHPELSMVSLTVGHPRQKR